MIKFYPGKLLLSMLAIMFISLNTSAQITTYAGRSTYLGDGNAATSAGLFGPYSFAMDASGNLYIATYADNRVRKVDAATKAISTIAGNGVSGYSGDGGLATNAQLNFTSVGLPGIAVDKAGNVYIGDFLNNRIRKIDAITKIITTVAGNGVAGYTGDNGVATSAKINGPAGMAVDTAGNLYFCDYNNNIIRKIDAATKIITTVAGNLGGGYSGDGGLATAATLLYPECLAVDKAGNIYIADEYNSVIRKVTVSTGKISTVAGSGAYGFSGDGGAATSAAFGYVVGVAVDTSGNIYISDQSNNRIRKITASTLKVATIAGTGVAGFSGDAGAPTAAQIKTATTLQVDEAGNVYVDDFGNGRIRKITSTTITTVAGDGSDGFTGAPAPLQAQLTPQAIAVDATGNTYIADGLYYDVRIVNTTNSSYAYAGKPSPDPKYASKGYGGNGVIASSGLYNAPFGVAVDAGSNLYIADVFNNVIRKVTYSTKIVSVVAGNATAGFSGDGAAATSAQLNNPYGVAVDKTGNLYIADAVNNRIRKVDVSTQKISTIAGTGTAGSTGDGGLATAAQLNRPCGVAVDGDGNVFILDRSNKKIRMIAAATKNISTVLNNGDVLSGVAVDAAGNIFVSDSTKAQVLKLTAKTFAVTVIAGTGTPGYSNNAIPTAGQLNNPGGLAVNSAGEVLVADINNFVVRKIVPSAVVVVSPIANNVISTTDSVNTCTGKINITTLVGSLPTGGSGAFTYQWLKSTDSVNYTPVSGAAGQSYTVGATITATAYYRRLVTSSTYADSGNVIGFHVRTAPVPVITAGALAICKGVKDTLSTSVAYSKYAWSTGAATRQIIDTVAGSFYVTVTDAYGCTGKSAGVTITVNTLPAQPTITASPTTITNLCPGTPVKFTSSAAAKYLWSTGETTAAITTTAAASYTVTITDAHGCSSKSLAKTTTYKTCAAPASATVSATAATTASLTWPAVSCGAAYRIQYAVNGTTNWVTVTTPSAAASYTVTGLKSNTTYNWNIATVCNVSLSIVSTTKAGTAFKTAAAMLAPIANNTVSTTDSVATCTGKINITTLNGSLPTGGDGTFTYQWLKSTDSITYTAISGAAAQNYTANAAITTTAYYRRLVTSSTYKDSGSVIGFHVRTNPVPVIATGALAICKGVKDTLSTTVAYSKYAWNTGAATRQLIDSVAGTFYVTVTDTYGCTGKSAGVAITVNALPAKPTITALPTTITDLCPGTSVKFTSSTAAKYAWSTGETTAAINTTTAGTYTVTITDAHGCTNVATVKKTTYKACGTPVAPVTSAVTATTARFTWRAVPCAVNYRIQYAVYGSTTWKALNTPTADTTYKLSGLLASTKYSWKVSTVCVVTPENKSIYIAGNDFTTAASLLAPSPEIITEQLAINQPNLDATVYPNPSTRAANLSIKATGKVSVVVADMSGRIVWRSETEGTKQITLPSDRFAAGMYLVTVNDGKNKKVLKFIKQ